MMRAQSTENYSLTLGVLAPLLVASRSGDGLAGFEVA